MLNIDLDGDSVSYSVEEGGKNIIVRIVTNVMRHSHFDIIASTENKEKKEVSHKASFYFKGSRIHSSYNDKHELEDLIKEDYYQNLPNGFKRLSYVTYTDTLI